MEKLSLYSFLSILLPGALLTMVIEIIAGEQIEVIKDFNVNQQFMLAIFLSSSIFLGTLIHISTKKLFNFYKAIKLFIPVVEIYKNSKVLKLHTHKFYKKKMGEIDKEKLNKNTLSEKIEYLWSDIYHELEAFDKIKDVKAFQSFYYFFRNFFTMGLIVSVLLILQLIYNIFTINIYKLFADKYFYLLIINLSGMLIGVFAGKWNRVQMVNRLFWTYYSLNKNK